MKEENRDYKIDIGEFQKQQAEYIKKQGHYLELNILIEANENEEDNSTMPIITTCMHGCGAKDIAKLYKSLEITIEHLRKEHPLECAIADVMIDIREMGSYQMDIPHNDEEDKE